VYPSGRLGEAFKGLRGTDELAERRQQQKAERGHDFRRSGAVGAIVGGETAEALYYAGEHGERIQDAVRNIVSVNAETIRSVTEARRRGIAK
jgi:hypothetical protein